MSILTIVKNLRETLSSEDASTERAEVLLAAAIATVLPVPGEANGANGKVYYTTNHYATVKGLVNAINEEFLINVSATMDLVRDVYTTRFNFVHCVRDSVPEFMGMVAGIRNGKDANAAMNFEDLNHSDLTRLVTGLHELTVTER